MSEEEEKAVSLEDQIKCVAREIALRKSCYPKWVQSRRMTEKLADWELDAMRAVMQTLKAAYAEKLLQDEHEPPRQLDPSPAIRS